MAWYLVKHRDNFTFTLTVPNWWITSTALRGCNQSFRTGRLERELQTVQLSATKCSCIATLCVSLVSFATITLCDASQRVFIVVVYFVVDSVRKLLDTPSYFACSHGYMKYEQEDGCCTVPPPHPEWAPLSSQNDGARGIKHRGTTRKNVSYFRKISGIWASYSMDNGGSLPGVNWPEHEADHSPPFNAKAENAWRHTSASLNPSPWCDA
jgi:hypothetical protein